MEELRLWLPVVVALISLAVASYRLVRDTSRETYRDLQDRADRLQQKVTEREREVSERDDAIRQLRQEVMNLKDEVERLRARIVEMLDHQRRTRRGGGDGGGEVTG